MSARVLVPALCLSAALASGYAQTETPADQKAFTNASRISDPAKKIEALEKFKVDFPNSDRKSVADSAILSAMLKAFPDQKDRILKQAKIMYNGAGEKSRGSAANQIAGEFLDAGRYLEQADKYARKGVDDLREARYIQEQKTNAVRRKQKPPTDEELAKRFRESRAARVATLGGIEVALGHTAKGQKLLEEAWAANSNLTAAEASLGELAYKAGNDAKAMELLVPAKLSGKAPPSANAALEAEYRKQHGGSLDGLDAMLDQQYRKLFPNPVKVEEYHPTEKRGDRLVVAEVFTGAGCPPCVGADLAFDAAMERYSPKELAVVMYHEHVPRPDPMANPDAAALYKALDVRGVPSYAIDGKMLGGGGGSRDYAKTVYDRIVPPIEKELELPAEAKLSAHASVSGSSVKVTGSVDGIQGASGDVSVRVLLLEKEIRYSGENGIRFHPMVVRAIADVKAEKAFDHTFNLDEVSAGLKKHLDEYEAAGHRGESFKFLEKKWTIDHSDLAVVVMVQDAKTRHVLQSAMMDLSTGSGHLSTGTK